MARAVLDKYAALDIGLADASLVVLAARHRVGEVLTLDRRRFNAIRQVNGRPFRILP